MKVEVNKKKTEKELEFPCLMIDESDGHIVFFKSEGVGVSITNRDSMAFYNETWFMDTFKPFKGSITLSND